MEPGRSSASSLVWSPVFIGLWMLCLVSTTALGGIGLAGQGVAESAMSQIELDGSLPGSIDEVYGPGGSLYIVQPDLENLVGADEALNGGNLFYSLRHFILAPGDSALFPATVPSSTVPSSLVPITLSPDNAIVRVTGGLASEIFGPVDFAFDHANVFFLNPYGVIVGEGGSFDVPASFFLSTADRLSFQDGHFETHLLAGELGIEGMDCCRGEPTAFGFDFGTNNQVVFDGQNLDWQEGVIVQVVAGDVGLTGGGKLKVAGGEIHLTAVGDAGTSVPTAYIADAEVPGTPSAGGVVRLVGSNNDTSDLSTLGGTNSEGRVVLRGSRLVLTWSTIQAGGNAGNEAAVDLGASESIRVNHGLIQAFETEHSSDPRHVGLRVTAPEIVLEETELQSSSGENSAGAINIDARESLTLIGEGSKIWSTNLGEVAGGDVDIAAETLTMAEGSSIYTRARKRSSRRFATGAAGNIRIDVGDALLDGGSAIESDSETSSVGGSIDIVAERSLSLRDSSSIYSEAKADSTFAPGGPAGNIDIVAKNIWLETGSTVRSTTIADAPGGSIQLEAVERISLSGNSQIYTESNTGEGTAGGRAGSIAVSSAQVLLETGSSIRSTTKTSADSGSVWLEAGDFLALSGASQIYTESSGDSALVSGRAGRIEVLADDALLESESNIRSTSLTGAQSGQIDLFVDGSLTLSDLSGVASQPLAGGDSGDVTVHAGSITLERGGTINTETSTSGATGAPGDITLIVDGAVRLEGVGFDSEGKPIQALISTRVVSPDSSADAGNIEIHAGSLELIDGGLITSRTTALDIASEAGPIAAEAALAAAQGGADAGNIIVDVDTLIRLSGSSEGLFSEIAARGSAGSAGSISLIAENVDIRGGAGAFATSFAAGDAGTIDVTATESIVMVDGFLLTERGNSAGGGEINMNAGDTIQLQNSRVEATVRQGTASGGNISIGQVTQPRFVVLSSSQIRAEAEKGKGGDITISAGSLIKSAGSDISAASGDPTLDGEITIDALEQELTGRALPLGLAYLDVSSLLQPPCAARLAADRSSLTVRGRPALGSDPGGMLPSPILGPGARGGNSPAVVGSFPAADHILASGRPGPGGCSDTLFWDHRP